MKEVDNVYTQIEDILIYHKIYQCSKDYSKAKEKIRTYLIIGNLLNNIDIKYGRGVINDYAKRLSLKFGKKYTVSLLYKIKKYYNIIEKVPTLSGKLTWSHWYEMLSITDINKIIYYVNQCEIKNIDVRGLREKIKSKEYERLPEEARSKIIKNKEVKVKDLIKDPIVIKNKNNIEKVSEKILQQMILEDISSFLEELGSGFAFIKSEYRIKIGSNYNYIDLLLFNYEYNCFIVLELKVSELKKEHIGQIQVYMNYIDNNLKTINLNKTIGIILVKRNNKFIMEYCSDKRILARTYEFV
ncbi:MAG: DUF1016 family protein [Bacilli bacterium]|nr:DUF1016 family protein [Bacilli bacterium]